MRPTVAYLLPQEIYMKTKRAYRRAKRKNLAEFKRLRNKVISVLRDSKKAFFVLKTGGLN